MIRQTINQFLQDRLPQLKIAVIGDIMVDRYVFGDVNRISPEAPVPVNRVTTTKEVLGGAANVAANLSNLDCQVFIGGVAGTDHNWSILNNLLTDEQIDASGIVLSPNRQTTTKMRILGDRQQMLRLDFEEVTSITAEETIALVEWLTRLCKQGLDGIVISDYGKGVCTSDFVAQIMRVAKEYQVSTVVDPKGQDWHKYIGASYITPNVKEVSECLGYKVINEDDNILEAGKQILAMYDISNLVITRSAKGITAITQDGNCWHSSATQQDVFDVSGAGDTVVAMIITAVAGGLSMRSILHLANAAAGIVVAKVGTYPIHRQELLSLWHNLQDTQKPLIHLRNKEQMAAQIRQWQNNGETVIFTNGCFDILHKGHVTYLQEAAQLGDHLIIGLNSDASVRRLKGLSRPVVDEESRATVLMALGCVDGVVLFEEDTPAELLSILKPNVLVKGGDYEVETVIGKEFVDRVEVLPFVEGCSTTGIIEKIKQLVKEGHL